MKNYIFILSLLFLIFCGISNPAFAGYTYYRTITVQSSQISGGANLTQFPILVCGNGSGVCSSSIAGLNQSGGGAHVQNANGYDIIFTTDSGCSNKLTWEMEKYVASTGEFEAWVTNTSTPLSYSSNTTFYLCYGNASISSFQSTASSVWDSNYLAVYHFPNGTTLSVADSTTNANNGANTSVTAAAGEVDGGAGFNGGSSYVNIGAIGPVSASSTITLEAWVNQTSMVQWAGIVFSRNSNGGQGLNISGSGQVGYTWNGNNSDTWNWSSNLTVPNGQWALVAIAMSASQAVGYLCSGGSCSNATNSVATSAQSFNAETDIGQDSFNSNRFFNGLMDEVRISNITRSTGWITTEYNNQSAPSSFYTMGCELGAGVYSCGPVTVIFNHAILNNYKHY